MLDRQAIADALATVPGLTASPLPPETIVPGMAWPERASKRPLTMHPETGYEVSWYAFVALTPGSRQATIEQADAIDESVSVALQAAQIRVELWEHLRLQVSPNAGDNTIPVLRYRLTD